MSKICCVHRGRVPLPKELGKKIQAVGHGVSWLEMTSTIPEGISLMPAGMNLLLVLDNDPAWCLEIVSHLRTLKNDTRWLPVVSFCEKLSEAGLKTLIDGGIDDVFTSESELGELGVRLRLRIAQSSLRATLDRQVKEAETLIAKSETMLKQREEFLSVCAHDLRSPLGLIQTSLSMVLNNVGKGTTLLPDHEELLIRARRQAGQAIDLVKDLLDVMALEQGLKPQYQLLQLHQVLHEFYKDYEMQAGQKTVRFHYENKTQDWRILADADRLRQLLQNLFTNALKFTEPGKNIFLKVEPFIGRRKSDPAYPMIVISIKDEGKGIPAGEIQKIFDRFTQIKKNSRADGRGLGLTVAKQISNLHDGNIWVESKEGEGSTFFVLIPHVLSKPAVNAGIANRILVVEPVLAKREEHFNRINGWGFEVVYARDGVEAVTMLSYLRPGALVLTAGLQKIDEVEVAAIVKTDPELSTTPVIFVTDPSQPPQKKHSTMIYDKGLKVPFIRDQFVEALGQKKKRVA